MQKKRSVILFTIVFLFAIIIFSQYLIGHYATDTYNIANVGYENYAIKWSLKDGRMFMFLIVMLANIMKMKIDVFVFITLLGALAVSSATVVVLKNIISQYKKEQSNVEEILLIAISYVTIFNFMYIENLYFVESIIMAISILLIVLASDKLIRQGKKGFLLSIILIILSVFCYQGTIGFYIAMVLLLSLRYNGTNIKKVIWDIIKAIIIVAISVLLNILAVNAITKITGLQQTRMGSFKDIFSNIVFIVNNIWTILTESVGLFPRYLQLTFITIITTLLIIYICTNKNEDKSKMLKFLILILVVFASGFSTYVLSLSSFFTGRLRFSIGALIGVMYIYLYLDTNIFKEKVFKYSLILILLMYMITIIIQYIMIMHDSKMVNTQEKNDVKEIVNYIQEYEESNDVEIRKLAIGIKKSEGYKTYYENIKNKNILTYNALKCDWSVNGVIWFYGEKKLKQYYISNIDTFVGFDEEYKCVGDTLYIKVYNY